jgi:hypothetical protein
VKHLNITGNNEITYEDEDGKFYKATLDDMLGVKKNREEVDNLG